MGVINEGGGGEREPREREPLSGDLLGQKWFSVFALGDLGPRHASFTTPPSLHHTSKKQREDKFIF